MARFGRVIVAWRGGSVNKGRSATGCRLSGESVEAMPSRASVQAQTRAIARPNR